MCKTCFIIINFARYFSRRMVIRISFIITVLILLASCSGYEKLIKGNDYDKKYSEAMRYYEKEDYLRASTLFDQCAAVFRGTKQADTVHYYQAMSYYNQRDYIMASHYFSTFATTYGASPFLERAEFMEAYCYYLQSPRPKLDQSPTKMAIQKFSLFLIKHPRSDKADEARQIISELRNKLVEKSFLSAKLYFDMEDYKASLIALNNSVLEYPESKYREELLFMILKSSFMYANNSVASKQKDRYQKMVDDYYSFIAEFPESKHAKEAKRYFKLATKKGGSDTEESDIDEVL